jgi:putative flippase GtrA
MQSKQILRFGVVGIIGYLIDASILTFFDWVLNFSPLYARAISFPIALSCTWYLNRTWTFKHGALKDVRSQYALYVFIQVVGRVIDYSIFALLIITYSLFESYSFLAVAVGSLIAMVFTYLCSTYLVFSKPSSS